MYAVLAENGTCAPRRRDFVDDLLDEVMRAFRPLVLEHTVDGVHPFLGFLRIDVRLHVHGGLLLATMT